MSGLKLQYSDGAEFDLLVGQIWEDKVNGEPSIKILYIGNKYTQYSLGDKLDEMANNEISDYLEPCCYSLKL
jgi:hypothetical protein